jgi:hypothetical protein
MKCGACGKDTEYLAQEPIEPGKNADSAKEVCLSCHDKAQEKVAKAQEKDSVETADKG